MKFYLYFMWRKRYFDDSRLNILLKKKICELIEIRDKKYTEVKELETRKSFCQWIDYVENWEESSHGLLKQTLYFKKGKLITIVGR